MEVEEGFQIHIQSQQSWQLMTYGQGCYPARAEHHESDRLVSLLQFPGIAASMACIICTVYRATLLKIVNHDHPLPIPKD